MYAAVHDRAFDSTIQGPFEGQAIRFERWTFIHATGEVKRQVISDIAQDFPRMNERLAGKPYRYAYSISLEGEKAINYSNARHNRLLKHDLHTGQTLQHAFSEGYISGEVIFIPKPAATREDEGWLVSYVHALDNSPSWVVILDAEHIEQPPQAVIELPVRVPLGFHTHWASS